MRVAPFDSITDATFTSSLPSSLPAGSTGEMTVSTPTNAPSSKRIDVTVTYPIGDLTKNVTLTAYVDPEIEGAELEL